MKLTTLQSKLDPALPLLRCPLCGNSFTLCGTALRCANNHSFDLSAKGYVNFAPNHDQRKEKYDDALFASRSRIFENDFYLPILNAIETMLTFQFGDDPFTLADIGCGEGYYTRALANRFPRSMCFGVDLSRDGITRAARGGNSVHWLVADLKRLPIMPGSLDLTLDILTPADYEAFKRALKPDGQLIKVIAGDDYLCEVRQAIKPLLRNGDYRNQQVLDHLEAHAKVLERVTIRRTFPLDRAGSADFLHMTPMTFSIPGEALADINLQSITIHMEIVRCQLI